MKYYNNPLNIRSSKSPWLGLLKPRNGFCRFEDLEFGIRAGYYIIFKTYLNRNPFMTVAEMIQTFAPVEDGNNTNAYLASIFAISHITCIEKLSDLSLYRRAELLRAMCIVESQTYLKTNYIKDVIIKYFS